MKTFNRVFTVIVFLFLYIPMIVLAVASFNAGTDIAVWKGFTFAQYGALFRDGVLLPLLANSVIVAVIASLVATVLGTMAAIGIRAMSGRMRRITMAVTNIPLTNPEIVTGVSLALLFAFAGQMMKLNNVLGFTTLLIAHITFNLPYVILSVMPKLGQLDPNLLDAALDLGCTPVQAFFKVIIHEIMPGILSGVYDESGRLCHFVFCLRPQLCHAAGRDLQLYEKAAPAEDLRAVHAALPCDPPCDGRDESRAGRR